MRNPVLTVTMGALLLFLAACNQGSDPTAMVEMPPPSVTVSHPTTETVTQYIEFTGKTRASQMAEVRAKADGYITEIRFEDGGFVKKGQILVVIDPSSYEADVAEAAANLQAAKADQRLAETLYTRRKGALEDDAVSEFSVAEAKAQLDLANAAIAQAEARLSRAKLDLSYTQVRAPISGRIGRHLLDVGNLIQPGASPVLAQITAQSPIHVYFNLSEDEFLQFQNRIQNQDEDGKGLQASLGLGNQTDYPFLGNIDFVDTQVDGNSGTLQARAAFANDDGQLVPGLYARIHIPMETYNNALLVPETAVGTDQQGRFLLLADENSTVAYRPVQIGALVNGNRVITQGISPQDRIIIKGAQMIRPGMPVTVIEAVAHMDDGAQGAAGGGQ